jgi:dienelactone hydrolase
MDMSFSGQRIELANGIVGETLRIPTTNPVSFYQAISEPDAAPRAEIVGKLFKPDATASSGSGPWPLVIVVPGSLGVAPSHIAKAEFFAEAGIGTCVIDPFGERGVTSTVANQAQYSFAASAMDVLATGMLLAGRDDIDGGRIGAQGHSRGGSAVLSAACMSRLLKLDGGFRFRGVYAAYPWCGQQFQRPEVGDTVVRAVIGERDEWCLPQQVQAQIHAIRLCGGDASSKIFPDAHHSFDRDTPLELVEEASVSPGAPTVYIADDGAFVHPLSDTPDPALTEKELMLYSVKSGHGRRGAHIGSAGRQAELFHADMMAFWRRVLLSEE